MSCYKIIVRCEIYKPFIQIKLLLFDHNFFNEFGLKSSSLLFLKDSFNVDFCYLDNALIYTSNFGNYFGRFAQINVF